MALFIITVPTFNANLCTDRAEQEGKMIYLEFHTFSNASYKTGFIHYSHVETFRGVLAYTGKKI